MERTNKNKGLTKQEAKRALKHFGLNELKKKRQFSALRVFLRQFTNFIVWILIAATLISYGIGEVINFWVINFIIVFIILMGFLQEFKAEKAIEALKAIVEPTTTVVRDKRLLSISSKFVVPGDILSLEVGDKIPADAEVLEETALRVDESTLTGESEPVARKPKEIIFAGTQIVHGKCIALVQSTGMKTKLGSIAEMIQEKEAPTPLQVRFDKLGKLLAIIAISAAMIILGLGIIKGATITQMLIVALALAVAAVPEGLPLTMTLALSFGMHRMAQKKSLVRRMMAVETLGSTTVICSDKTGTLTKNEMTVERIYFNGIKLKVTGAGYKPEGEFHLRGELFTKTEHLNDLLRSSVLCNNAQLIKKSKKWEAIGDPTELALLTVGAKAGFKKEKLEKEYKRAEEILFTSTRRMMTTVHKHRDEYFVFSKGAPEEILSKCKYWVVDGRRVKMTTADKKEVLRINHNFARKALRVLGIAEKCCHPKKIPTEHIEKDLTFLGLVGMKDPARPEVKLAIETCNKAGIEVVMITGDHEQTAISIARQIGMVSDGEAKAVTGKSIDGLADRQLLALLKNVRVFARTQPEHKLRLVTLLKKKGHIVAMTGDGVNDAPALKKADIGIAMGIKGTDVTKEASEMILEDDNFATIVEAVKEGRRIYRNIEKFTGYLISRNFTEVILIFLGIIFFDFEFLPLLALQILFINAFDEEMPAIALGLDEAHHNIMIEQPRNPKESILNKYNAYIVFSVATFMALVAFIIFITQEPHDNIEKARTMVFATIVAMVIFNTFNFRSLRLSSLTIGLFSNRLLNYSILIIAAVTFFVMYYPVTQKAFVLVPLSIREWAVCITAAFTTFVYMESIKWFRRKMEGFELNSIKNRIT